MLISEKQKAECSICVYNTKNYDGCAALIERLEPCNFFTNENIIIKKRKKGDSFTVKLRSDIDINAEVISQYNRNIPIHEIAHDLNITESHVVRILEDGGYL